MLLHRLTQAIAAIAAFEETQQRWEFGRSQAWFNPKSTVDTPEKVRNTCENAAKVGPKKPNYKRSDMEASISRVIFHPRHTHLFSAVYRAYDPIYNW